MDSAHTELFATKTLGSPERAVGFVLWRVLHAYVRAAERALAPFDLTHLQFQTLALAAWLGRTGADVSQSQLAKAGDIGAMQVSHMMKTLEAKGWIIRSRNASDVRAKSLTVTAAGVAVLRKAFPVMVELQHDMFGEDGDELLAALHRVERSAPGA
jgi:MarR family transcriptional regulator, organic hydroperoxide resistance regulator